MSTGTAKNQPVAELKELRARLAALEQAEAEHERAKEALARQASELELLHKTRSVLARELDLDAIISNVVESIHQTFGYALVSLYLLEGETLVLQHQVGYDESITHIPIHRGISGRVARTGKPVLLEDVTCDPDFIGAARDITSEVCVPLFMQGEVVGILNVETGEETRLTDADLRVIEALGEHVSIAIVRAKLHADVRESEERYRQLVELSPSPIGVHSKGRWLFVNPTGAALLGAGKPEALVGQRVLDYVHPDYHDIAREHARQMITDGQISPPAEEKLTGLDGRVTEAEILAAPIVYQGQAAILVMARDITDRKQAQEALQHYARRLETLHEIDRAILAARSPQEIARAALDHIRHLLNYERASVTLFDFAAQTATILVANIDDQTQLSAGRTIPLADFDVEKGLLKGQIRVVPDLTAVETPSDTDRQLMAEGIRSCFNVPLMSEGKLTGTLNLGASKPGAFKEEHVASAGAVADSLAIAIRQARLREELDGRVAELEALRQASLSLTSSLELEEVLNTILETSFVLLHGIHSGHIFLYQDERVSFAAARWHDGRTDKVFAEPRPDGLTYTVARQGEAIVVPDIEAHPVLSKTRSDWRGAIIGLPLKIGQRVVGVMNIANTTPRTFTEAEMRVMRLLGDQAAIAIENARLYEIINRRNQYLMTLRRVSRRSVPERNPQELMQAVVDGLTREFGYSIASILLGDDEVEELQVRAVSGSHRTILGVDTTYHQSYDVGLLGWVMRNGQPRLVRDTSQEPLYTTTASGVRLASELTVPIRQYGKTIGVLNVESDQAGHFSDLDLEAMVELADELAVRLENVTLYEQTQRHAEELEQRVAERTEELNRLNEHLKSLARMKDEFVANMSHELRTPIASLKLYHNLLISKPEKADGYLETLERETDRLKRIIEDLLQLSRMDQGQVPMRIATVDLNELVRAYAADRPLLAHSRGLALNVEIASELPPVQADEGLMGQVLSILLTNAMNYTTSGGEVTVSTHTRQTDTGRWVGFRVKDTGMGISNEDQAQLFQRFFRGKAARDSGTPGTGLGLSIVKEIVDRHNGQVEVVSTGKPGQGATFSVWLPLDGSPQESQ